MQMENTDVSLNERALNDIKVMYDESKNRCTEMHNEECTLDDMKNMYDKLEKRYNELHTKYKLLRTEMHEHYTRYYMKKDVIHFLKYYCASSESFKSWCQKITIIDDIYLQEVFENNLTDGIKTYLSDRISLEGIDSLPFRSVREKAGILYILTETATEWQICSHDDFEFFINAISHAFTKSFVNYQKRINLDDDLGLLYLMKITGAQIKKEKQNIEIKSFIISLITVTLESIYLKYET